MKLFQLIRKLIFRAADHTDQWRPFVCQIDVDDDGAMKTGIDQ